MLKALRGVVENDLPTLIRRREIWRSLVVTYEPPRVERIWTQHGDLRVLLHRIWPCDEPLFHPHPWPSAVRIVSGRYLHSVGNEDGPLANLVLGPSSEYEMTNPNAWHSVNPIDGPSDSIMILGPLYPTPNTPPRAPHSPQQPLDPERLTSLLDEWTARLTP
jgi:hypothetical protein